jgi:hypothetical protein
MRGYLVDPFNKTVTDVETDGYPHFKTLIGVDLICTVTVRVYDKGEFIPPRDTIFLDDEGLYVKDQAYFLVAGYAQPLAGKGILLGTDAEGETVGAYMEFDEFKKMVSFIDVELDHMESIPEGTTEKHPIFGDEPVPVFGSYPVFRHKSKSPSDE